ncbi:mitochondrial putative branched-chain-amino-acid aminotransferase [Amylocarpus encephaloides]|uniref:Branched-chain-amino-acid aminotransferase n=1 Tax=Amylocarpus encephaloides TaxID=45428 RepID=A0A9P7YP17_9HELO|nr:mitochondrial putative branched-chain-amino-acid aminotransferase [Amylocarpus encephaloides]
MSAETIDHLTANGVGENLAHPNPPVQDLDASKLRIELTKNPRTVPKLKSDETWSCKACTDHMVKVNWLEGKGWGVPEVVPYGPLTMMPTASCLHYATQCFEGMKVYRGFDGKLRLFRPDRNCARLMSSAVRVALPAFDPLELEKLIKALMKVDGAKWLPESQPGNFLYLRPAMTGNGEQLGVTAPSEVLLFIIAVPWPDISTGWNPSSTGAPKPPGLKLLTSQNDTRAWPGGFDNAKVGAKYGPAFVATMEGRKKEAGASNFFVVWKTKDGRLELITAPLDDKIILDGVTRRSVLDLARERFVASSEYLNSDVKSLDVVERTYTMAEVEEAQNDGRIIEAFVSGTAYFITPVSAINFRDAEMSIPMAGGDSGHYARIVKKWLLDIKYGNVSHKCGVVVGED